MHLTFSRKRKITLEELEKCAPARLLDIYLATLVAVEGAGYRVYLSRKGTEYEVVSQTDGVAIYFPDLKEILARLMALQVISHTITLDVIGLINGSRYHNAEQTPRLPCDNRLAA